jgi:hypothetical protein
VQQESVALAGFNDHFEAPANPFATNREFKVAVLDSALEFRNDLFDYSVDSMPGIGWNSGAHTVTLWCMGVGRHAKVRIDISYIISLRICQERWILRDWKKAQ